MQLIYPERILSTARFLLEPISAKHAAELFEPLQAPELYTFIPDCPPKTVADLERKFVAWSKRQSADRKEVWLNWAIRRASGDEFAGTLQATIREDGVAFIAYAIFPDFWRQGIGRECCQRMIDHLFCDYRVVKISALADTRNEPSWRFLEALGFFRVERIEAADEFKGNISHEFLYELMGPDQPIAG